MSKNLVNLTVNPCKMCMPMGVVNAFYGISKCMTILHGSQGCSTYIRRHMATHYNEPVDIASSSLTEEGTVYGGEKNLIKGIENLIKLYNPDVVGVATTCLAETIGEDIDAIIKNFYIQNPQSMVKIIPVPSGGYMGTQYEGFFRALYGIVKNVEMDTTKNQKINVITSMISPEDTRYLKSLLDTFGLDYILLPDISDNLDGVHNENYSRLPDGGTTLEQVSQMAGARFTVELTTFIDDEYSPAKYLKDNFNVPYKRLNLPVGLRDTDALVKLLEELGGKNAPTSIQKERGRYIDAMIDSHKYNAEGRATIFGEPDFIFSMSRLCCENGIVPVVVAAGTKCAQLKNMLGDEIEKTAKSLMVEDFTIIDNTDFEAIEEYALKFNSNIMIGNSDGRRIEEKNGIPLVRCSFPVHDRMGGQRTRILGYNGSLNLLDKITNVILEKKEGGFRKELYNKYFTDVKKVDAVTNIEEKTKSHPCYSCSSAHKYARIHLPVAPKCNISCNYCVRKFDCPNESRPGVTTQVLTPEQALERYIEVKQKVSNLSVVGIAGPGDALADFENTKPTLSLIREYDKDVTFCLSTNGLLLPLYANELIELGVTHVTITINAVDPQIGAKVYKYINFMGVKYEGIEAATILMTNQLTGLKMLTSKGIVCKVNIVALKGINDEHIEEVVKKVKELGATITNIMQMIPVEGSAFEGLPLVSMKEVNELRNKCGIHMQQMYHCRQCRADAVGLLDEDKSAEFNTQKQEEPKDVKSNKVLRFAIASKGGMLIDQHFGHASEFHIYEYKNGNAVFKEKRNVEKYCIGADGCDEHDSKIDKILSAVKDCDGVIALRVGNAPEQKLKDNGIRVFTNYDRIESAVIKAADEIFNKEAV